MSKSNRYKAWWQMVQRCTDPDHKFWKDYGGRGITVEPVWLDFSTYYADTGEPPTPNHTLDRVDNSKGYGPDNWRWATKAEQARNRRSCVALTFKGDTRLLTDWAKLLGVGHTTLMWRLRQGWPIDRVLASDTRAYHNGRILVVNGVSRTLTEWAAVTGVSKKTISTRLFRNWPPEDCIKSL